MTVAGRRSIRKPTNIAARISSDSAAWCASIIARTASIMRASPALRPVQQLVVGENQRHHRLDDRGAADTDAGVVTTLGHDIGRLARLVDRRQDRKSTRLNSSH